MKFEPELIQARFIKRYKRFFADVQIDGPKGSEIVTAHCPNTGSMRHCLVENSECWISKSNNPKRKLGYTLEAVSAEYGGMAGVNTALTNKLVKEALVEKRITELSDYDDVKAEVKFGRENSRLDFLLSTGERKCYVEVKNVTLGFGDGEGAFPDAVTERGRKHLHELMYAIEQGQRAVLFFCVQHTGIDRVRPAWEIDPKYGETLRYAVELGLEVMVYGVEMSTTEFAISKRIEFLLSRE